MVQARHLIKPPIAEAAVAVVFDFEEPPSLADVKALALALKSPDASLKDDAPSPSGVRLGSPSPTLGGFWIRESENKSTLLLRQNEIGFITSSYTDWEVMMEGLGRIFEAFSNRFCPKGVIRISTRFINTIFVDEAPIDLGAILTCPPMMPDGFSDFLVGFQNVTISKDETRDVTALLRIQGGSPFSEKPHILLDIDAATSSGLATKFEDVRSRFSVLREVKNLIFFGSLHEPVLEKYK